MVNLGTAMVMGTNTHNRSLNVPRCLCSLPAFSIRHHLVDSLVGSGVGDEEGCGKWRGEDSSTGFEMYFRERERQVECYISGQMGCVERAVHIFHSLFGK